jgi:Fur family peroxide stress response transcriptional regulator
LNRTGLDVEERLRDLSSQLRRQGMSVTHQRLAVYRALLEDASHPDAEKIHQRIRKDLPSISLATVYKAIDALMVAGKIAEVDAPRSATRYEAVLEPHHHLICDVCGHIEDLHVPEFSRLRPAARDLGKFEISACSVQFHGRCAGCAGPKPARGGRAHRTRRPKAGANQGG